MTTQPLVAADDADWTAFKAAAPEWFLGAAGAAVRNYCGWHLAPNLTVTLGNLEIGSRGIIMLPSRYVTAVSEVVIATGHDDQGSTGVKLESGEYQWHAGGWIVTKGGPYLGGYYFGPNPAYLPIYSHGLAQVTFTHGYQELPDDIKAVIFELAQSATDMPAGNVKGIAAPNGFQLDLSQPAGMTLNCDQRNRLANYRLQGMA